jgi:hypothetical protein
MKDQMSCDCLKNTTAWVGQAPVERDARSKTIEKLIIFGVLVWLLEEGQKQALDPAHMTKAELAGNG